MNDGIPISVVADFFRKEGVDSVETKVVKFVQHEANNFLSKEVQRQIHNNPNKKHITKIFTKNGRKNNK